MKTLKYEEVLRNDYRDLAEATRCIERFLEQVYNEKRLHSALGYRPPAEFCLKARWLSLAYQRPIRCRYPDCSEKVRALEMRFLRHDGIYRSDEIVVISLGRGAASRRSGPGQAERRDGRRAPCPSFSMSSGRPFLDRGARQHCPSPLHRHVQLKLLAKRKATNYH